MNTHKPVCISPGLYESTYRCQKCCATKCVSIEDRDNWDQERCPVSARTAKIIRKLVYGEIPEATIRRHYKMTIKQLEAFKERHASAIQYHEAKIFNKVFDIL